MGTWITVVLALAITIGILILIGNFRPKRHYVRCSVEINAPLESVFQFLRHLQNQEKFNNNAMRDANRTKTFTGTDGTVGFIYAWAGDRSAGVGEKEIMQIEEGKRIECQIRFMKPMKVNSTVILETEQLSPTTTLVHWSNESEMPIPLNLFNKSFEKMIAKDMNSSLQTLKSLLEAVNECI